MKLKIIALILFISLTGCTRNYLVYAQDSSLGVDLHAAPTEGDVRFVVGYDRTSFALIPKLEDGSDAMSMAGLNRVYVKGIDNIKFSHAFAAGDAAKSIVKNPEQLKRLVDRVFVTPAEFDAEDKRE